MDITKKTYNQLESELEELRFQLEEANDTIDAIRTGQIDALLIKDKDEHQLYTLKTADQTYRIFIEKMNEGAVTLTKHGLILYSNSRFADMVSTPLEKVIGAPFNDFIADASKADLETMIAGAWDEDCKGEIILKNKNQLTPTLLSCTTLEFDGKQMLSLILTDLSILKDAELQLKQKNEQLEEAHSATEKLNNELEATVRDRTKELFLSREHFKLLSNNIPQMTWTNLPDGEVNYYNQLWYDYTGETTPWNRKDIIHPDDLQHTMDRYTAALQSGNDFEVENRYKRRDGVYRWHLNRSIPLRDESGEVIFWVGTATDIEDQKKEMERKDEFIGIASHELKTPLTSLKGYLQLINHKKADLPESVKQYIDKAVSSLNKLQRLVNDLLDVSKIQAGRLEYGMHSVNLSDLISLCIENARHVYPNFEFVDHDGTPYLINGNEERLEQVLMNLINNAVKYSPVNNKVVISSAKQGNMVRIAVTDLGIGLSAEQQDRIFERFYRVEDKKYMSSGLGMGLYISQEIIHNHNGVIGVHSELGKGSTFYFDLPLIEE